MEYMAMKIQFGIPLRCILSSYSKDHSTGFEDWAQGAKQRMWSQTGYVGKSNSQPAQYERYLKVPLLPDYYGAETFPHKIIYMLKIEMTERIVGWSDIFKGRP